MTTRQLSVFVENKKGRLAEITSVLAQEGVDIRAVSVSDTADFGILRLILNDPDRGCEVLRQHGCTVSLTEVIIIRINDQPGGLAAPMGLLYENGINVEYMYAFLSKVQDNASVILRVSDVKKAMEILSGQGYHLFSEEEVRDM